jgi:hypothetical protein
MNAIFTVVGIVIGALLTFFLTRRHESEKHKRAMITQAYSDYLRGVAEGAHLNLESNEAEIHARIADAKARICLYGSPEVVAQLAAFEKAGASVVTPAQHEIFASLVLTMRGDSKVQRADLETVLFGNRAT